MSAARRAGVWGQLPFELRLLLVTQFAFNVGFYLVVPFLAAHLEHDLDLAGWVVGAVLGLRTFSQQGMFVVGGALADRFGVRTSILVGCLVRIAGFVLLGLAGGLAAVTLGVVLVGLAAALFSPATEAAITAHGGSLEASGGPSRAEVVGLEAMATRLGSVVGPALGGVLLVVPFTTTCLVAAGVFGLIWLAHLCWLRTPAPVNAPGVRESLRAVLAHRGFLAFAVIHASYLLTYNMLYLALPVELARAGAPSAAITWFFMLAAVVVMLAQLPVTRWTATWTVGARLRVGYLLLASCFLPVASVASWQPLAGPWRHAAPALMVVLLHLGQVLVLPMGREVVARLAGEQRLGTFLGALSSLGGLAVLLGGVLFGAVLDLARVPRPDSWLAWCAMALPPLASALAVGGFLRRRGVQ